MTKNNIANASLLPRLYRSTVLAYPIIILALLALCLCFFGWHAKNFALDSSADALLLESDPDLQQFRESQKRYATDDFLFVTYTPDNELFEARSLDTLTKLRDELRQVGSVESVFSLVEVPLLTSSGVSLTELTAGVPTLQTHPDSDLTKVKEEITTSPVFRDLIISEDGTTTALQLTLKGDAEYSRLHAERAELRLKKLNNELTAEDKKQLQTVSLEFDDVRATFNKTRHNDIKSIRAILSNYQDGAELHLGGVPMITDDMSTFISSDLVTFGIGVLIFILAMLALIFRRLRWVLLPVASCLFSGVIAAGLLGLLGWKVTVISSNFLSLMFILTMSMNIHLIVRFRQLKLDHPELDHTDRVWLATRRMFWPCLYTALTTIIGFCSLVFSGIRPVVDFGWIMSIGLCITFFTSFMLFPTLLVLIGPLDNDGQIDKPVMATSLLAKLTEKLGPVVLIGSAVIAIASGIGISRLIVENSFINYFKSDTEIYQGMKLIDQKLGGTTPMDVLLDLTGEEEEDECADLESLSEEDAEFCEEMAFLAGDEEEEPQWFTAERIDRIKAVHDYLDSLPAVGKVLSLASVLRTGEVINDGEAFTPFELEVLYKKIPDDLRAQLIDPYISIENNEARVTVRIKDSLPDLRRKELLEQIQADLPLKASVPENEFKLSGLLVLYNNMLQSLFQSQIQTFGAVLLGIGIMFLVLFRSFTIAVIGIIPNALAAAMVLGVMGLAGLPLDIMTITIAAISIGIAVDNSIHYIYRFKEEFPKHGSYVATMHTCHKNIGRAVLRYWCSRTLFLPSSSGC